MLSLLVAAGATDRLVTGTHQVHGLPVLIISGIAAAVMVGGVLILGGDIDDPDDRNLNMRAVLLDTAADAAAAAGVAAAGGVILATDGLFWLDPVVALVIALVVGYHVARLLGAITTALRVPPLGGPWARANRVPRRIQRGQPRDALDQHPSACAVLRLADTRDRPPHHRPDPSARADSRRPPGCGDPVLRDDREVSRPVADLVPGDLIVLAEEDLVPRTACSWAAHRFR